MPADPETICRIGWAAPAAVNKTSQGQSWALIVLCCYLVVVFIIVFVLKLGQMPLPERIGGVLGYFHDRNLLIGIRYGHIEAAANVLFFVPLGVLVPIIFNPPRWLVAGYFASGCRYQSKPSSGSFCGRVASFRDIVCNAIGAGIGVLLTLTVWRSRVSVAQKSPVLVPIHRID